MHRDRKRFLSFANWNRTIKRFRALTQTGLMNTHSWRRPMGQSKPLRATALVVEDDPMQREMICLLLEESEIDVIECESAEAAELVLQRHPENLVLLMTDVQLAGNMNGAELAHIARKHDPELDVIVTSGKPLRHILPEGVQFWKKPW